MGDSSAAGGEGPKAMIELRDHFTLGSAITPLRFRDHKVQVIQQKEHQIVIEEDPAPERDDGGRRGNVLRLTVKRSSLGNFGLSMLRVVYTVGAIVLFGFVFAASIDVILHVFLSIVTDLRPRDGSDGDIGFAIVELLSVPVFVHALANAITLAVGFVADVWEGFVFFRHIGRWSVVWSEWVAWAALVFCPLLTLICTIFSGSTEWWHATALALFFAYLALYSLYAFAVLYYECKAAVHIFRKCSKPSSPAASSCAGCLGLLGDIFLVRIRFALSIYQSNLFSVADDHVAEMEDSLDEQRNPESIHMSWFSKALSCGGNVVGLYERLTPPRRIWSLAESLEAVPFFTRSSWTLGGLCCASASRATVSIISGKGALTSAQWISSAVCIVLSVVLVALTIVAVLWFFEVSVGVWVVVIVILAGVLGPRIYRAMRTLFEVLQRLFAPAGRQDYVSANPMSAAASGGGRSARSADSEAQADRGEEEEDDDDVDAEAEARRGEGNDEDDINQDRALRRRHQTDTDTNMVYYQVWETVRLAQPKPAFVWTILALEIVLLFLLPWAAFLASENYPLAVLFFILGAISGVRHFFSPRMLLREFGREAMFAVGSSPTDQMRLDMLLTRISRKSVRVCLVLVLTLASIIAFALLVASAYNSENASVDSGTNSSSDEIIFLNDFDFPVPPPPRDLYYPTCRINANAQAEDVTTGPLGLSDMAFLSHLAYVRPPNVQAQLDAWFGSDVAVFQRNFSETFLESSTSPVSYYLVAFPGADLDVVTVRGTVSAEDAFADLQLWLTALLFQAVRAVVPFGGLLTTIIPNLVDYVSTIEAANIEEVSYYRELSRFVQAAMEVRPETRFLLTGHSLGGGLAIVTGAQLKVLTVAISGVNAMLSRKTFDPPISEDDLNKYVFNVVPDRDPISRVDDVARLYQRIECDAPENSILACHTILRTLCEISYRCGGRPPLCECTTEYGYPEPTSNGTRTFAEACGIDSSA